MQCLVKECERNTYVRGYCGMHYLRMKRHGDPLIVLRNRGTGETFADRFWSKVALTADDVRCWNWQAGTTTDGYGTMYYQGKNRYAHRLAWLLTHKKDPTLHLLHSCDNPRCVNPNHLREGTNQDNMDDMVRRNRQQRFTGQQSRKTKLTELKVRMVYQMLDQGQSRKSIADYFGVHKTTIGSIDRGASWAYANDRRTT